MNERITARAAHFVFLALFLIFGRESAYAQMDREESLKSVSSAGREDKDTESSPRISLNSLFEQFTQVQQEADLGLVHLEGCPENQDEHIKTSIHQNTLPSDVEGRANHHPPMESMLHTLQHVSQLPSQFRLQQPSPVKPILFTAAGGALGLALETLFTTTGLETAKHEWLGHFKLGGELIYRYNGTHTAVLDENLQVDGFTNFQSMCDNGMRAFPDWITGKDTNSDNASGWANAGLGSIGKTSIGENLGPDASSAWISLTGSLPGLFSSAIKFAIGEKLFQNSKFLGSFLMTSSFIEHMNVCTYPFSVLGLNATKIEEMASHGHDFANFALKVSKVSHHSPESVASVTAGVFAGLVPLVALGTHFYLYSGKDKIVPDELAIIQFLQDVYSEKSMLKEFERLFMAYPKSESFGQVVEKNRQEEISHARTQTTQIMLRQETEEFLHYISHNISSHILEREKRKVLNLRDEFQKGHAWESWADKAELVGLVSNAAVPICRAIGQVGPAPLGALATSLTCAMPLAPIISTVKSGVQTYQDFHSDPKIVPMGAKIFSGMGLVADALAAALAIDSTVAMMNRGEVEHLEDMAGWWQLPAMFCAKGVSSMCYYIRNKIIKAQVFPEK